MHQVPAAELYGRFQTELPGAAGEQMPRERAVLYGGPSPFRAHALTEEPGEPGAVFRW
jgi:hypothetical protein